MCDAGHTNILAPKDRPTGTLTQAADHLRQVECGPAGQWQSRMLPEVQGPSIWVGWKVGKYLTCFRSLVFTWTL
jgi:hypothetical protein